MVELRHIKLRFGQFVADLFSREGFEVEFSPRRGRIEPDLLIHSRQGVTAVAEIKLYSSRTMPTSVLDRAAAQVERSRRAFQASKSILIICPSPVCARGLASSTGRPSRAGMTASRTSGTRRHGVHHQRKLWVWLSGLEFDKMGEANAHL